MCNLNQFPSERHTIFENYSNAHLPQVTPDKKIGLRVNTRSRYIPVLQSHFKVNFKVTSNKVQITLK